MRFGPYSVSESERLKQVLVEKEIPYAVEVDRDGLDSKVTAWKESASASPGLHQRLDSSCTYFEIEEVYLPALQTEFDKLGYSTMPISEEAAHAPPEFLCLKCKHSADSPRLCPKHKTLLVPFTQWVEGRKKHKARIDRIVSWVFIFVIVILWLL